MGITKKQIEMVNRIKNDFGKRLADYVNLLESAYGVDCVQLVIERDKHGEMSIKGEFGIEEELINEMIASEEQLNKKAQKTKQLHTH